MTEIMLLWILAGIWIIADKLYDNKLYYFVKGILFFITIFSVLKFMEIILKYV